MTDVHVCVAIYIGGLPDIPQHRHTALWLRFGDGTTPLLAHIVGDIGAFRLETQQNPEPWVSRKFYKMIPVGKLDGTTTEREIVRLLQSIPIEAENLEYNCQWWVEAALKRLAEEGLLTTEASAQEIDEMSDVVADALVLDN